MEQPEQTLQTKHKRWGEWIIEKGIAFVASFSIIVIFLIFVFIFRESLPLFSVLSFSSQKSEKTTEPATTGTKGQNIPDEELKPERYDPDAPEKPAEGSPESYDPNAPAQDNSQPESYDPNAPAKDNSQPESYDPNAPAKDTQPESYDPNAPAATAKQEKTPAATMVEEQRESVTVSNLLGNTWQPVSEEPKFGIMPLIVGTAKTTLVAILLGAPLGILAALYSAFFAKRWIREVVKPVIEILAGFPSVVVGFFCLMIVGSLLQSAFGLEYRLNAFVGGIGLAIAVIPIVFTITEDALSSVPRSLWEASLAIGATEWETAYKVMLPAAFPGVFAAVLLGVGRAFGETMIALMATGNAALVNANLFAPARTFAATIGAEMGEVVWGSTHYNILFLLGVILFVFAFTLNSITELYVKERLIKKFQGN